MRTETTSEQNAVAQATKADPSPSVDMAPYFKSFAVDCREQAAIEMSLADLTRRVGNIDQPVIASPSIVKMATWR